MTSEEFLTPGVSVTSLAVNLEGGIPNIKGITYTTRLTLRKKKKRSTKWNDFEEVNLAGKIIKVKFIHCKTLYAKNIGGSTSLYLRHLERCSKQPRVPCKGHQIHYFTRSQIMGDESQGSLSTYSFDKEKLKDWVCKINHR